MRASRIGVFAVMALPLTVSVVAHSLGNARMDRSVHRSPQAPAAQPPPQAPPSSPRWVNRQRQAPCWRVAGIAPQRERKYQCRVHRSRIDRGKEA